MPRGPGDVLPQHLGDRAAVDPTHELVGEDPDRQGVVEERLPRMPERALRGEPLGQRCVVQQLLPREPTVDAVQARLMGQQLAHRHAALAALRELWPVRGDRRVEIELLPLDEQRHDHRRGPLAAGVHRQEAVDLHPLRHIDHALARDVHGELGAVGRVGIAVRLERLVHGLERRHRRLLVVREGRCAGER